MTSAKSEAELEREEAALERAAEAGYLCGARTMRERAASHIGRLHAECAERIRALPLVGAGELSDEGRNTNLDVRDLPAEMEAFRETMRQVGPLLDEAEALVADVDSDFGLVVWIHKICLAAVSVPMHRVQRYCDAAQHSRPPGLVHASAVADAVSLVERGAAALTRMGAALDERVEAEAGKANPFITREEWERVKRGSSN